MSTDALIEAYIAGQPAPKQADLRTLHQRILAIDPGTRLWFLDGKDDRGQIVSNPNIGYGFQTMAYAGGNTRDFYRVGLSANTSGISVYIIGLPDKNHLRDHYAPTLGKASVTGYCIKFKALKDIDAGALEAAIRDGLSRP